VVTGASGGVGRALARELASRGYDVGLLARGAAGLEGAAEELRACGARASVQVVDVANFPDVDRAGRAVEADLGPISLWINNAMTTVFARVSDLRPEEIQRATAVTYLGQVHGTLAALERMKASGGTIVSVGSALAFRGIPMQAPYCGAKFAVRGFMESLRAELIEERSKVHLCQVHLPAVNTTQFGWCRAKVDRQPQPVPPIYQPEVIARRIVDAAEHRRRQHFIGGWNWLLVHLNEIMPGVGDHYMARTGVRSQLTDRPLVPRPDDLDQPVDRDVDHGSHGTFDDRAHGMFDPTFLRSLPHTVVDLGASALARTREVMANARKSRRQK
jgi:short-subunit dehydrogenase